VLVLDVPPARSFVLNLAENGVELGVWGWVKNADYWRTRGDLLEKIKLRFDREGITIPFPQREVHLNRQAPPATDRNGS
jgi:small conductance mechanosensitive channel